MTGRIISISGNTLRVQGNPVEACFGCMNMECKSREHVFTAEKPPGLRLSEGQVVEVENPRRSVLAEALGALLPPLLGFIGFYGAVTLLLPSFPAAGRAAAGVAGMLIAGLILYFVKKHFPPKTLPRVTRVIT